MGCSHSSNIEEKTQQAPVNITETKKSQKEPSDLQIAKENTVKNDEDLRNPIEEKKAQKEEKNQNDEDKVEKNNIEITDQTELRNFFSNFKEEEINLIEKEKAKKEENIKNGVEEEKEKLKPIYQKVEFNFINEVKIMIKNYLVLYLPENYKQFNSLHYPKNYNYTLEFFSSKKLFKANLKCIGYEELISGPFEYGYFTTCQLVEEGEEIVSDIEFVVSKRNLEKKLIIIDYEDDLNIKNYYGFYDFFIYGGASPMSVSFFINENFKIISGKDNLTTITESELFSFNENKIRLILKNISIKINIKNELGEKLLSKFSEEEIKQINFSLNTMNIKFGEDNLIYHKAVHNIKNEKNFMKLYYVVFTPKSDEKVGVESSDEDEEQKPIIIKKFTINNILVKNNEQKSYDDNDEKNSEDNYGNVYGYYISNSTQTLFRYSFSGTFAILELDCESNENVDFFKIDCSNFIDNLNFMYGSSFKYEIILNGNNSIKFSNKNFKYKITNDKISFEGYLDACKNNYDEKKYFELAKNSEHSSFYLKGNKEDRPRYWISLRAEELIPDRMEFIKKK